MTQTITTEIRKGSISDTEQGDYVCVQYQDKSFKVLEAIRNHPYNLEAQAKEAIHWVEKNVVQ